MIEGKKISESVIAHLTQIMGGRCSITTQDIEDCFHEDPAFAEILMGLSHLHEDLVFRQEERDVAEGELRSALRREEEKNDELRKAYADAQAAPARNRNFSLT
jgi:hypothetical protein